MAAIMVGAAMAAATTEATHPHLQDMIRRVFPETDETAKAEREMDAYFGDGSIRAGVVFLLKDLRDISGQPYRQNKKWGKCTYLDQAIRSARSVLNKNSLLGKFPKYPLLFYHADWRDEDKTKLETAVGLNMNDDKYKAWWHPVVFGPEALPPYLYNVNATITGWQQLHVDGDLRRETRNNIHGFGYMLMCRFYAGLIHHAPLTRKLDYYLRIDGDSRLQSVKQDPFEMMKRKGAKYATLGGNYRETAGSAVALPRFYAQTNPDVKTDLWTSAGCSANAVACPATQPRAHKATAPCALRCVFDVPAQPDAVKLPVPLCKSGGAGPPRCPSFYNNFEVVDLQAFRTAEQWAFFLLAERSHAFLCEAFPGRTRPGRCGGGGMGDAIFRTLQVNTFLTPAEVLGLRATVSYHHPAPIAKFCGPRGVTDGGPPVQSIS